MEFGELFKRARLAKGITLEEVEEEIKVRRQFIEALENENFKTLPAQIYAAGFVKIYARFLRLNQQYMVDVFMHRAYDQPMPATPEVIVYPEPDKGEQKNNQLVKQVIDKPSGQAQLKPDKQEPYQPTEPEPSEPGWQELDQPIEPEQSEADFREHSNPIKPEPPEPVRQEPDQPMEPETLEQILHEHSKPIKPEPLEPIQQESNQALEQEPIESVQQEHGKSVETEPSGQEKKEVLRPFRQEYTKIDTQERLELIKKEVTASYQQEFAERELPVTYRKPTYERKPLPERKKTSRISLKNIIIAILFLVIVIWLGNIVLNYIVAIWNNRENPVINQPVVQNDLLADSQAAQDGLPPMQMIIDVTDKSWLTIYVDGEHVLAQILQAGTTKEFFAFRSINVLAGNAGGVKITLNGNEMPPFGEVGEMKNYVFTLEDIPEAESL